jgi:hypothetical protein
MFTLFKFGSPPLCTNANVAHSQKKVGGPWFDVLSGTQEKSFGLGRHTLWKGTYVPCQKCKALTLRIVAFQQTYLK